MRTLSTLAAAGVNAAASGAFATMLIFAGLVPLCIAFAWDGLVRRHALVWSFPVGATLGQQAASITRLWAVVLGAFAAVLGLFLLLLSWEFYRIALKRQCPGHASLACTGALASSTTWIAWAWFSLFVFWFVFVWLRFGDPRKRVLVSGIWYQQDRAAELVNRQMRARGLAPLAPARLYTLQTGLVRWLNWHGWLGSAAAGPARAPSPVSPPGGARGTPGVADADVVQAAMREQAAYRALGESEREAVTLLIPYFLDLARRGQRQSPIARWWARTGQLARLGIYGRRTL